MVSFPVSASNSDGSRVARGFTSRHLPSGIALETKTGIPKIEVIEAVYRREPRAATLGARTCRGVGPAYLCEGRLEFFHRVTVEPAIDLVPLDWAIPIER